MATATRDATRTLMAAIIVSTVDSEHDDGTATTSDAAASSGSVASSSGDGARGRGGGRRGSKHRHSNRLQLSVIGATSIDYMMTFLHPMHALQLLQTSKDFNHVCCGRSSVGNSYWWSVLNLPTEPSR